MFTYTQSLGRRFLLVLLALSVVMGACKTGSGKKDDDKDKPPIRAKSADAQKRFDRAMELLRDEQYQKAKEAFRLLQAEFGSDPIAHLSELYVARASMGRVRIAESFQKEATDAYDGSAEAKRILASLAESDNVDKRIRYGAQAYHGLELALRGQTDKALAVLGDYPSASVSDVVLEADQAPVRVLLVESLHRSGRHAETLEAASRLHEEIAPRLQALDTTGRQPLDSLQGPAEADTKDEAASAPERPAELGQLESFDALALQRAFAAAENDIEPVSLQDYLTGDEPLLRAAAGWGLLRRRLDEGVDAEQRAVLEDLFNRVAPDMAQVGAGRRAAELSMRLAAAGGPQRLAVGFLLPLSGPHKAIGQRAMAGALVAMRAFHHAGHPEVTVVFQDSGADAKETFERLEQQKVLAVIGPLDKARAEEFAPLAREAKIPMVTLTTESVARQTPPTQDAGADEAAGPSGEESDKEDAAAPFVFRNFIDATAEARAAARIAFDEIGDRKAAVVFPSVGYGRVTSKAFADEFRALGGQIVAEISYDRSKSNFERAARKLAKADPEAVFVPDTADKVAEVTAFFAAENIWGIAPDQKPSKRSKRTQVHYLGTSLWEKPMLIRQAASYIDGAAIPVWFSPALASPAVDRFVRRFEAIYGRKPEAFEAFSYDTVNWLRSLMLERGMGRAVAIRDALVAGDRHDGVTGKVEMTATGEPRRALRFITPTSEGFKPLPFTAVAGPKTPEKKADGETAEGEDAEQESSASQDTPPKKMRHR